jgi:DMSO/TMAO reductase YedYZ molybdopterin-dependent catalytic subunit
MSRIVTRVFTGRRSDSRDPRPSAGEHDTAENWPVLAAEATQHVSTHDWSFSIDGLVERSTEWTCEELLQLPRSVCNRTKLPWEQNGYHDRGDP